MSHVDGHALEQALVDLCWAASRGEEASERVDVAIGPPVTAGDRSARTPATLVATLAYDGPVALDCARVIVTMASQTPFAAFGRHAASQSTRSSPPSAISPSHASGVCPTAVSPDTMNLDARSLLAVSHDAETLDVQAMAARLGVHPGFVEVMQRTECGRLVLTYDWDHSPVGPLSKQPTQVRGMLFFGMRRPRESE
jgi:hypothetical protein